VKNGGRRAVPPSSPSGQGGTGGFHWRTPTRRTVIANPTRLTVIATPNSPNRHCEPQLASPSLRTPTRPTVIANPNWGEATQAHAAHRKIRAHPASKIIASRPSPRVVTACRLAPHRHREPPLRRRGDPGLSTPSPLPPSPTCPQRPLSVWPRYAM
jgi:hypothetical protein